MAGHVLGDRSNEIVQDLIRERKLTPNRPGGGGDMGHGDQDGGESENPSARNFWVILDSGLPAATYDPFTNQISLGTTTGTIWRRDLLTNEPNSQDPLDSTTAILIPQRNDDNTCVRVRVFNGTNKAYLPCVLVEAEQDTFGDLYVTTPRIDALVLTEATTTEIPTSTTSVPPPCNGYCKWTWDGTKWTKDTDTCIPTASTTTTSTTSTTTTSTTTTSTTSTTEPTTTLDPCQCGTTPAPGSTTTTTVAPPGCSCPYPSFCGSTIGDCTRTFCIPGTVVAPPSNPLCTTTYNPSSTTTTTCNCNTSTSTSTTPIPNCSLGCDWYAGITGGSWQITMNGCSPLCPCSYPFSVFPGACDTTHTPCVQAPPTTTTGPPPCSGICGWLWDGTQWVSYGLHCTGLVAIGQCVCSPPSVDGNSCTPPTYNSCYVPNQFTTTTIDPNLPPGSGGAGPCWQCYTSSTTTTTTTANPCGTNCIWKWNGSSWSLFSTTCSGPCTCPYPGIDGFDTCQKVTVLCQTTSTTTSSTSTTTTTTTTTTSTTSTTTTSTTSTTTTTTSTTSTSSTSTTPIPCTGNCTWRCIGDAFPGPIWQQLSATCAVGSPGCACPDSSGLGACGPSNDGEIKDLPCAIATTTTTAVPTICGCDDIPPTIQATVSNTGAGCICVFSSTAALIWDAVNSWWIGNLDVSPCVGGGEFLVLRVKCTAGVFKLDILNTTGCLDGDILGTSASSATCSPSPFALLFLGINIKHCCTGIAGSQSIDITVGP